MCWRIDRRAGVSKAPVSHEVLALDGGKLSGVHGWEVSDGKPSKMCMDRLEKFSAPTSIRGVDEKSGKKVSAYPCSK